MWFFITYFIYFQGQMYSRVEQSRRRQQADTQQCLCFSWCYIRHQYCGQLENRRPLSIHLPVLFTAVLYHCPSVSKAQVSVRGFLQCIITKHTGVQIATLQPLTIGSSPQLFGDAWSMAHPRSLMPLYHLCLFLNLFWCIYFGRRSRILPCTDQLDGQRLLHHG